jgi:cytochrome o ubiquinol oxidase operon protein cyoD
MNVSATIRPAEPRGSLQSYVTGALLALALTLAPFALVMGGVSGASAVAAIFGLAVIQIVVHLVFFLHLGRLDQRWNLMAFIFTALIVVILIGGSYWVMYHLNDNMMPAMQMGSLFESNLATA